MGSMHTTVTSLLTIICLPLLGSCDQRSTQSTAQKSSAGNSVVQDINQIESGVRLAAANKRIDELERKVGALEATPEKLDLDLLTQRVTALEVKAIGEPALTSKVAPGADVPRTGSVPPKTDSDVRRAPAGKSKLTLPELESRQRLATPVEAKAFSRAK